MLFVSTCDSNCDLKDLNFKGRLFDYSGLDLPLYELSILRILINESESTDTIGLISERFQQKTLLLPSEFEREAEAYLTEGYDIVVLNPYPLTSALFPNSFFHAECSGHKGIVDLALKCGFITTPQDNHPYESLLFCNYIYGTRQFIANYLDYVDEMLEYCQSRGFEALLEETGSYQRDSSTAMKVFFAERILGQFLFCQGRNYKIKYLKSFDWNFRKYAGVAHIVEGLLSLRSYYDASTKHNDKTLKFEKLRIKILQNPDLMPLELLEEPMRHGKSRWLEYIL